MHHSFFTIAQNTQSEHKEKGSRFLAFAYRFRSESELKQIILALKTAHFKAVHCCWAYRIDHQTFRSSDDGEPSGTAGKPILNVLLSNQLEEALVVVVRYFGGTLLGVPGLIKAYKEAAATVISTSEIIEIKRTTTLSLAFGIENMNDVMKTVKTFDLKIKSQNYTDQYLMDIEVHLENKDAVSLLLKDFLLELP